jgi:hypothetical protein
MKIAGSGSASISKRYGSADPDTYHTVPVQKFHESATLLQFNLTERH